MLREPLREGVAHERGGRRAARLEAHPEADEGPAHEGARVARQDLPGLEHHAQVHARADALEAEPLLHGQQYLADPEEPDDRHDEIEPFHEVDETEGHPELAGDDVEAHRGEDESQHDGDQRLQRVAAAQSDEARKGQELDREEFGRTEAQGDLGQERREERDQHDREERADEGGAEGGGERLATLPLPRHRIAVERRRDRPRLARDVEEHRGDRAAEERAPVERRQQDDRRGGRHRERERQQDRDTVGAAEPGQDADDGPERDAEDRDEQVERRDGDLKAVEEVLEAHGLSTRATSRAGPWASAPGTIARTRRT